VRLYSLLSVHWNACNAGIIVNLRKKNPGEKSAKLKSVCGFGWAFMDGFVDWIKESKITSCSSIYTSKKCSNPSHHVKEA
jgi:hypothetical protein